MIRLIFSIIILFIVFIPSLRKAKGLLYAKEKDTLVLVKYLEKNSNKNDYIMSDYGELNFYAKRKTTLKMASLSKSAIQCGGITSDKLIKELNY